MLRGQRTKYQQRRNMWPDLNIHLRNDSGNWKKRKKLKRNVSAVRRPGILTNPKTLLRIPE
jgi:hypothetical protein